jgi:hypothetical protein
MFAMRFFLTALLVPLIRRVRPVTVALAAHEVWKRLPPEQRQRLVVSARRNAPRLASSLARRARPRV